MTVPKVTRTRQPDIFHMIPVEEQLDKVREWELVHVLTMGFDADGRFVWGANFSEVDIVLRLLREAVTRADREEFGEELDERAGPT